LLSSALDVAATCKQCVANDWLSFLDFCEAKKKEVDLAVAKKKTYKEKFMLLNGSTDVRAWYKEWMSLNMRNDLMPMLRVHDITYGLATDLNIECSTCSGHFPPINSKKSEREHETKSDLCKNEINVRFCFAMQLMGVGGEHAAILAAFLDLPEPTKWNRQFNVLEKYTYEAVQQVKETSQLQAAEDESLATVMAETNAIEQNLLEEEVPLHRIQASFDMGWQVRSSGHKYASPTGHGLLIGTLTKKCWTVLFIIKSVEHAQTLLTIWFI
jgi:hypothetical protein